MSDLFSTPSILYWHVLAAQISLINECLNKWIQWTYVLMCSLLWELRTLEVNNDWIDNFNGMCFIENKHFSPLQRTWRRTQCQHLIQSYIIWRHLPIFCNRSGFILNSFLLMLLFFCYLSLSVIALYIISIYVLDLFWHLCFLKNICFFGSHFTGLIW